MRVVFALVSALVLGACASDMLASQVGQPLEATVEKIGTPYRAFDVASGERAFVWLRGDWGMLSGYGNSNIYGLAPTTKDFTTVAVDLNEDKRCNYILYAKPSVPTPIAPEHWTVTSAKPMDDIFCY